MSKENLIPEDLLDDSSENLTPSTPQSESTNGNDTKDDSTEDGGNNGGTSPKPIGKEDDEEDDDKKLRPVGTGTLGPTKERP